MLAFPGMTPAAVWDLRYVEYRLMRAHTIAAAEKEEETRGR